MNITPSTTTGILFEENVVVIAWTRGSLTFLGLLILAALIGLGVWIVWGRGATGGAV